MLFNFRTHRSVPAVQFNFHEVFAPEPWPHLQARRRFLAWNNHTATIRPPSCLPLLRILVSSTHGRQQGVSLLSTAHHKTSGDRSVRRPQCPATAVSSDCSVQRTQCRSGIRPSRKVCGDPWIGRITRISVTFHDTVPPVQPPSTDRSESSTEIFDRFEHFAVTSILPKVCSWQRDTTRRTNSIPESLGRAWRLGTVIRRLLHCRYDFHQISRLIHSEIRLVTGSSLPCQRLRR